MTPAQAIARLIKLEEFSTGIALECALMRRSIETMHEPYLVEVHVVKDGTSEPPKS